LHRVNAGLMFGRIVSWACVDDNRDGNATTFWLRSAHGLLSYRAVKVPAFWPY
jgi:hypothetical protein